MIPPGSDETARRQELGDDASHRSFQPPPDSNVEMSEYEWSQWWEEIMNPPVADSESGWPDSDMRPAASLDIIAPLSHENESNPHNSSTSAPSQAHHTPAEIPLVALSSKEILALIMSFGDSDATDSAPEAGVTAVPHPHTLEVASSDVDTQMSNVRFDLPLSSGHVDSPPPSRSRYTPYKIIDRPDIHRGRHGLSDDAEHHAGPSRHSIMPGVPRAYPR